MEGTGLTTCYRCGALYKDGVWYYGYWDKGTAAQFTRVGEIPAGNCPICRKPPEIQKPVEQIGVM